MSIDESFPMASQEGPSNSKRGKTTGWSSSLKPSHADAFSQDSGPAHGNTNDLSDIFRELAQGDGLLGKFIHDIQVSWSGLEELKHANYILRSLPKGLKF